MLDEGGVVFDRFGRLPESDRMDRYDIFLSGPRPSIPTSSGTYRAFPSLFCYFARWKPRKPALLPFFIAGREPPGEKEYV